MRSFRPATALDEDVRIIVRTEDHDTAVSLLKESLRAMCQGQRARSATWDRTPTSSWPQATPGKPLEAAVQSEVEFDSVAPPESL